MSGDDLSLIYPDWDVPTSVKACVTTRAGGVSEGVWASLNLGIHVNDNPENVEQNRQRLREELGISEPAWLDQVHGVDVANAGQSCSEPEKADASVTKESGQVCVVMTADCLPVLFADDEGKCVAAAHAGWRGLHAGVLEATVKSMDVEPSRIQAWMGPAIGPDAFEVGPEVYDAFAQKLGDVSSAFKRGREDRWLADIYELARMTLSNAGVDRIGGGGFCTYSDEERFFSYRRESVTGRLASLIWIEE